MRAQGYSYLELCTVIALLSLLLYLSIPNFYQSLMRQERTLVLERLEMAIEYAKNEALIRRKTITVSGTHDYQSCDTFNWSDGFMVFENSGSADKPTIGHLLKVFPGTRYGKLYFKPFRQHLNIQANGTTINNGSFYYCPRKSDRLEMDGLIVNNSVRTRRPIKDPVLGIPLKDPDTPHVTPFLCR
jgi:Tfp pilus assembly protein FimT